MHAGHTIACPAWCLIWATFKRSYPQPHTKISDLSRKYEFWSVLCNIIRVPLSMILMKTMDKLQILITHENQTCIPPGIESGRAHTHTDTRIHIHMHTNQLRFILPFHIHKHRGVWDMWCEMG